MVHPVRAGASDNTGVRGEQPPSTPGYWTPLALSLSLTANSSGGSPGRAPRGSRGPEGWLKGASRGPHAALTRASQVARRRVNRGDGEDGRRPRQPPPRPEPGVGASGRGRLGPAVQACFTVKGVEYVEVAKLTPAKASALKVAIPGDPNPEDCRAAHPAQLGAGRVRDLADLPLAVIPTTTAPSVVAGARNYRNRLGWVSRWTLFDCHPWSPRSHRMGREWR